MRIFIAAGEKNFIAIGVCHEGYSSHCLPGWEPISVGFHMGDGAIYQSSKDGRPTNQAGNRGDIIKCSLRAVSANAAGECDRAEVLFCRNGEQVVSVLTDVPPGGLYGVVGTMSRNEKVTFSPPVTSRQLEFQDVWCLSTPHLASHREDGVCFYTGPGDCSEQSIASIRTSKPVNPLGDISQRSFALRILNEGEKNFIGIGVVNQSYPTHLLPGWEDTSIGYHADTGDVFHSSGDGYPGQLCKQGDVMECVVHPIDKSPKQVKVVFFKNRVKVLELTAWTPQGGFYFCFGMMSRSEAVQVVLPEVCVPYSTPKLEFEDVWETMDGNMEHRGSGICYYLGNGEVGTVRSRGPVDPFGFANSYEVKILDPGKNCYIALGVCSQQYSPADLPGWDDLSVGFHADSGTIVQKSGEDESVFSSPCSKGDVVSCTLEPIDGTDKQMNVIFRKNGQVVAKAIFWKPGGGKVFAQIGCMSSGEVIQIASPMQKISHLKPDRVMTPSTPTHSGLLSMGLPGGTLHTGSLASLGSESGGPATLSDDRVTASMSASGGPPTLSSIGDWHGDGHGSIGGGHGDTRGGPPTLSGIGDWHGDGHGTPSSIGGGHGDTHGGPATLGSIGGGHGDTRGGPATLGSIGGSHGDAYGGPTTLGSIGGGHGDRHGGPATLGGGHGRGTTSLGGVNQGPDIPFAGYSQNPHAPFHQEEMQQFLYKMYYHLHQHPPPFHGRGQHLRSATLPRIRGPRHPFPGQYGPYGHPFMDYTASFPPPANSTQPEDPRLTSQLSEPAYRSRYAQQMSSSSSASDAQSLLSSQMSVSSQLSSAPEDGDATGGLAQDRPPHLQVTGSVDGTPQLRQPSPVNRHGADLADPFVTNTAGAANSSACSLSFEMENGPRGASPLRSGPPLLQRCSSVLVEPDILCKEENKMFQVVHNASVNCDGSLQFASLHPDSPLNAFIMFRLPLSEKLNYFQVEIAEADEDSNIAVGVVWDHYPVYRLPGALEGSVAFHTQDGALVSGRLSRPTDTVCAAGDVIGCQAALRFKSECQDPVRSDKSNIVVEIFRNGLSVCKEDIFLPPNGFFPAVGFSGFATKVKVEQNIQLSPLSYFETHPFPLNFPNFTIPPQVPEGWQCLQSAKMEENVMFVEGGSCGQPSVIQSLTSFSSTCSYFQVQLQCEINTYSVLSIGAAPKLTSLSKNLIPGEFADSIAFLPLLGFIMSRKTIAGTVSEVVSSELYTKNTTIGVGVIFTDDHDQSSAASRKDSLPVSPPENAVRVFFTINAQMVSNILTSLPKGGFYPMLAVERECDQVSAVAKAEFPKQFPCEGALPRGFVRGAANLQKQDYSVVVDNMNGLDDATETTAPVRAMQGAQSLCPSQPYFELRILSGGGTYQISCGVAGFGYPLNVHPGLEKDSIAFHIMDGKLFHNGSVETVAAAPNYNGALIGCGASFPADGLTTRAEVFFTVNRRVICSRLVQVPPMGLFPTIGMKTNGGCVSIDFAAPDPCSNRRFNSTLGLVENIKLEGCTMELTSSSNPGAFQMKQPMSIYEPHYFTTTCLSERKGRVLIGFSTSFTCPAQFLKSLSFKACMMDIVSGKLMITNQYLRTRETCSVEDGQTFGVGIEPLSKDSKLCLLFFTVDECIVSYTEIEIQEENVYPCVLMMDSTTKLKLDICDIWPKRTPIGSGWGRYSNLKLFDSKLTHSSALTKKRLPVGFAQTSYPLTAKNPYFELEICSRGLDKAVAIGVGPRTHPSNQWIGWCKESVAYHCDDGRLFKGSTFGQSFGPKAYSGDIIGCGARFNKMCCSAITGGNGKAKIELFFTINGALINTQKVTIPPGGLFPTVSLESPSESVIFHQHKMFPPVASLVDTKEWGNAYSVHQVGRIVKNSCRHSDISGSLPKAFCQAKLPFSPDKPYFSVEIASLKGCIRIGASVKIPIGCTTPNTHSVLYGSSGSIILRKGAQKSTREIPIKSGVGDTVGCAVLVKEDITVLVIYASNTEVFSMNLEGEMLVQDLYPTIILTHPGDAVTPSLQLRRPLIAGASKELFGWLRSERVRMGGNMWKNLVQYIPGDKNSSVGVAQVRKALNFEELSYYEVEIIDPGASCTISVGAASADYPLSLHPGWCKDSVGYHGDDGRLFQNSGGGVPFGSSWKQHDVIGLGIRLPLSAQRPQKCSPGDQVQVYFTWNGVEVGHTTIAVPAQGLYPTLGLHSPGEMAKVMLGPLSGTPCNCDPLRLCWQSLSGVGLHLDKCSGCQVLSYRNNGRIRKHSEFILSMGVYAKPFSEDMQYFEAELLEVDSTGIAIGVVPANYQLGQAPGWSSGSVAYHTDAGKLHHASGNGREFGPVADRGDVIGCGITSSSSSSKYCSVFFTYNGTEIGRIRVSGMPSNLYPAIGLTGDKDRVSLKFMETFKPKLSQSELNFVGLSRINNCSYSEQIVKFKGSRGGICSSPAMAQFAVPLSQFRNYFAANIVECSDYILVGLAVKDYPMKYAPGTTSVSLAYDIMKGSIKAVFDSENYCSFDAPVCARGDTIGCGIEFNVESKTERPFAFFVVNGRLIRKISITTDDFDDLYPIVSFVPNNKSSAVFIDWNSMTYTQSNIF